jgi:hypothetical protein
MSGWEGKTTDITSEEWRRGNSYRTLLEMSGGEGKLQNITRVEWRRRNSSRTHLRGMEEREHLKDLQERSGGEEHL